MKNFRLKCSLYSITSILLLTFACKKEEVYSLPPQLYKISSIQAPEIEISQGKMGDWIALHGEHLEKVQAILFNDVAVDLLEVHYQKNTLFLQVPIKMPDSITNKIAVTTLSGSVEYDFSVEIPDLEFDRMFNEYVEPGDTIKIYGKFIDLYEVDSLNTSVFFNSLESPIIEVTKTFITTKVPLSAENNTVVEVFNKRFDTRVKCKVRYRDKRNVITSFDSDFPYTSSTGAQFVGAWSDPKPVSGNYLRFEVDATTYPNGLGWFYLFENSFKYDLDMIHHPEKYELKFEMLSKVPINKTSFFFYYYWADEPQPIGGEYMNVQTVNVWQTVSIPLDKIIPKGKTGTETNYSLNLRVENSAPVERVAMYFDNLRIYKKADL